MIHEATSPYMRIHVDYSTPQPPLVVVTYSHILSKGKSFYKVSFLGLSTTSTRFGFRIAVNCTENFKPADEQGNSVHCGGHGRHAGNNSLENLLGIVVYFSNERLVTRHVPQAIALFKDAFIVPLERRFAPPSFA